MEQHTGLDILIPPKDETPKPTTEDWRRWDQRLPAMTWIEDQVYFEWLVNGDEAATHEALRKWGPAWVALRNMHRPGTPEWVSARIEASMPTPRSACLACGSTDGTHQPWCPSHPDFD